MNARIAWLGLMLAALFAWILLRPSANLELDRAAGTQREAALPAELEPATIKQRESAAQDADIPATLDDSSESVTAQATGEPVAGVLIRRSDGSPATGLTVVVGDAPKNSQGRQARPLIWTSTDSQGRALLGEEDRATLALFREERRALYAAAHFPYDGPTQVLWPLTESQLESGQLELFLRPAGSLAVDVLDAEGAPLETPLTVTLERGPTSGLLAEPFAGAGRFGAQRQGEGRVVFPWVGVGTQGVVSARIGEVPATRFRGPLFERDQEEVRQQVLQAEAQPTIWNFRVVDAAGHSFSVPASLTWRLSIERDGLIWHELVGLVAQSTDGSPSQIRIENRPALLPGDQVELRLSTLRKRWRPRDVGAWMKPGEHELGLIALEPLPMLAAGKINRFAELGVSEIRFDVQELQGVASDGQEQWRPIRLIEPDDVFGTDVDGRFTIHGEPSSRRMRLVVLAGVWFETAIVELGAQAQALEIELKRRKP